jgi:hypothetical protein
MISGARTTKSQGRPLAPRTVAIREAILALVDQYDRMTVRGVFYKLEGTGVVPKNDTTGYRPRAAPGARAPQGGPAALGVHR